MCFQLIKIYFRLVVRNMKKKKIRLRCQHFCIRLFYTLKIDFLSQLEDNFASDISTFLIQYISTRSLGALRTQTSSWRPFGLYVGPN